jgi:hypothetical protein
MYDENHWTHQELGKIQFYLSDDIVLKRRRKEGNSVIEGGRIKVEKGQEIEEVIIPRGTPGVFLFSPKENRLAVSFESGSEKKYLMFGPNPKMGNRYVLLASEWDKNQGKVQYDGSYYWVDSNDAYAGLLVDLKRINKVKVNSRTASGNTIN